MTLALRPRRSAPETTSPPTDLAGQGIHRDPVAHDPIATGGFAQRLVHRISGALGRSTTTRRSFLTRTAVVGSALAVGPLDYVLKPGTAYGYLCGTCTDGWTAFCCTINNGRNTCPSGSFVAGWWKADNAAYCCGSARYIIDCNATCPTQCSCRCGGGSCDNRRTCCNQFRYGQCHTEIACYGPVVCRVATCVVPWQYDPSCTTTSRTDNRTVDHGAPCLTVDCGTPIAKKYAALGGSAGILGPVTQAEHAVGDNRGRRARYRNGNIYHTSSTGAREVHGALLDAYTVAGGPAASLGYPTSDTLTSKNGRWRYNNMEKGRLYFDRQGSGHFWIGNPIFAKHEAWKGINGQLGWVTGNARRSTDGRSVLYQNFSKGRIYVLGGTAIEIHGAVVDWHEKRVGGVRGVYGYPTTDLLTRANGAKEQVFEGGRLYYSAKTGAQGLYGAVLTRYLANGGIGGFVGLPTASVGPVSDGRGAWASFEKGTIYALNGAAAFQVHGKVASFYAAQGGPTGSMGYPTSELDPRGPGRRFQQFENARIEYLQATDTVVFA
jgi:hypothetical protein